jgi:hypothetical protein
MQVNGISTEWDLCLFIISGGPQDKPFDPDPNDQLLLSAAQQRVPVIVDTLTLSFARDPGNDAGLSGKAPRTAKLIQIKRWPAATEFSDPNQHNNPTSNRR